MSQGPGLTRWRAALVFSAITISIVASMEIGAYFLVQRTAFFDSWEYVTMEHSAMGFVPRPGARSMWSGVPIRIDESGLRNRTTEGRVEPRRAGELLVLCVGDSTTFGNSIPFEQTYAMVLESLLQDRSSQPVRVVNLGVPGHQSAQSLAWLESWLFLEPDVVVFADSFNNRVHMPDEPRNRAYELDGRPIYLAVLFRQIRGQADLPAVPLERELPAPRIDIETYRQILTRLTELSHDSGFRLVLLAGGDHPSIENWARSALGDVRSGLWERVLGQAAELRAVAQNYYLSWYYGHRALLELGRDAEADALHEQYQASETAGVYYLNRFVYFAQDYISVMREVAHEQKVPHVDMRPVFSRQGIEFLDITHFGADGHRLVAQALASELLESRAEVRVDRQEAAPAPE